MKPCFGYIRVSTQKQGEGVSLEAQKDAINSFASRNNLSVIEWFEEKETAAKSGRPVFTRMLKLLERGKATGLIIHKIDRSARNLKDWAIIGELSDRGIGVHFATESLDFRSRGGRLTADIQAVIAADYIRNLREETKKGIDGRLKQGLYPFPAPVGYLNNGGGKPKSPCPIKAPLIRELFKLYVSGTHSIRSLQVEAKRRDLTNVFGGKITKHGIETILRNPFYCGMIEVRRTGALYQGVHAPIIDLRTFRYVQDLKAGRTRKKVTKHNHLYRGLVRCGLCTRTLSPELQKGRVYYRCHTSDCPTTTVREDVLEAHVAAQLTRYSLDPAEAEDLQQELLEWINGPERAEAIKSLDLRIDQAKQRLNRLTDLLIDETISKQDFDARKRSLALEIAQLEEERREAEKNTIDNDDVRKFFELATSLCLLYVSGNYAEKRSLVENCFSNRELRSENLVLEPYDWLFELKVGTDVPCGAPRRPTSRTIQEVLRKFHRNDGEGDER
jgi:site-specific DNA recombinase